MKYLKSGNEAQIASNFVENNHEILNVYADTNLLEMLMLFQAKSYRYAVVIGKKKKVEPGVLSIMYSVLHDLTVEKRYDSEEDRW